uniref:AIG1-type G domain-containing protein n=1 Tax=Cyprinus carpio TaxID=7962 RepID=A0A8C2KZ61_CYPCA
MNTITIVLCITSAFLSSDAMTDPNLSVGTSVEKDCLPVMERQNSKDDIFLTQHKSYLEVDKLIQSKQNRYGESNLSDSDSTLQSMDNIFPNLTIVSTGNSGAVLFGHENILLGEKQPNIENAETPRIVAAQKKIAELYVSVINMTGLHEAELYLDSVNNVIGQVVNENKIHAFIFIVRLGQLTDADKMGLEWLQRVFGDKVLQFVVILFTYETKEECDTIKDYLQNNPVMEQLLEKCGGRYHTCNKMMNSPSEMSELINKIKQLFNMNQEQCYTGEMFNTMLRETEAQQNPLCENGEQENRFSFRDVHILFLVWCFQFPYSCRIKYRPTCTHRSAKTYRISIYRLNQSINLKT